MIVVALYFLVLIFAVAAQSYEGAVFFGGLGATITDIRFIVVCLLAALAIRRANIFVLSVVVGAVVAAFLHLTLQDYWRTLGVAPSFLRTAAMNFAAALFALAVIHSVVGNESTAGGK